MSTMKTVPATCPSLKAWGRGIEKINHECREHGIEPPIYDLSMSGPMVTFRANPDHLQAAAGEHGRATTQETTQETTQDKILALLRAEPSLTRRELAKRVGITVNGIKYHLDKMKAAGRIRHVGPDRGGHWEVIA